MPYFLPLFGGYGVRKGPSRELQEKAAAAARRNEKTAKRNKLAGVAAVSVPEDIPIFATCDDVRRMIETYLAGSEMSKSAFAKTLGSTEPTLSRFLQMAGESAGIKHPIYRKAWRYFEQLRIYEMREKSAVRLSDEEKWGPNGFHKPDIQVNTTAKTSSNKRQKSFDPKDIVQFTYGEPAADDTVTDLMQY